MRKLLVVGHAVSADGWWAVAPPVLCAALCAFVPVAFAQTIPPTLDACSTESDGGKRLACFDREIARLHELQRGAGAPAGPQGAGAGAAAPRAGSNTTVDAKNAVEDFGLTPEMQHRRQAASQTPAPLREISAHVSSVHYLPRGEIVVGLDNGQTWRQAEYDGDVSMKVGEAVTIKAGALSAYYMRPRVGRIVRVRRLR